MADAEAVHEIVAGGGEKAALPIVPLVLAIVVAVVVSVGVLGGAGYWLLSSGRLGLAGGTPKAVVPEKKEAVPTKLIALDPLLVNLADADGKGYLRVTIVLRVEDPPPAKGEKVKEPEKPEKGKVVVNENETMMRDAALSVIGRENGDALLAADGKDRLKVELRDAMKDRVPQVKVVEVLLTEFLVQK